MKKVFFLAAMAMSVLFISCDKDNDPSPTPEPGTKLLKRMTKVENNVTTVYNFVYNAANRLESVKTADGKETTLFSYDANGNLTKIDETEEDFHNVYSYTYTNNLPVSGTFKSWTLNNGQQGNLHENDELTYTVAGGVVSAIHLEMLEDANEIDFALTYTNGNLTFVESVGTNFYKANFTFGTKKSPFPQVSKFVLDQAGFSMQFASKNEIITMAYDFPGSTLDHTVTSVYTYDAAGYPLTSNDGSTQLTFSY